jgi:TetR/AcrR family transcriptional regulator, regulator of cefoperazone and chloramphenicol sensitivity
MAVRKPVEAQRERPQRGDATRKRLIEAAIEIFAAYGFDGASTRMLAERARANLGAIPYYFGSKAGLYRASAQHIADGLNEKMIDTVTEVELALKNHELDDSELFELFDRLMIWKFAAIVLGSAEADSWSYFIVREQMRPCEGFEILYRSVMARIQKLCVTLVARLTKEADDDPRTTIRAMAIIGEIMVFRTARAATMKRLGWTRFTEARLREVQSVLRENARRIMITSVREAK